MIRALVLANSHTQFYEFARRIGVPRNELRFVDGFGGFISVAGFNRTTPVILLEGYEYNRQYDLWFMWMLGLRFFNIGFLSSEEWLV